MTEPLTDQTTPTRRTVLAAASALGLGSLAGTTTRKDLVIDHVCEGDVTYKVCVSGDIKKGDHADGGDRIIDGTCAKGGMGRGLGKDSYTYTGRLKRARVDGPAKVIADGTVLHDPNCDETETQTQKQETTTDDCDGDTQDCGGDHCPLDNEVTVTANVEQHGSVFYDITVTGQLELQDGERVTRCRGELDPKQTFEITFPYSGEVRCLSVRGPGEITIDQDYPCNGEGGK